MSGILTIDGSLGEGGGQILRTSLTLALYLRRPFRIINIRSSRKKPGLRPQHLAAVRAAAELSGAEVDGAVPGSRTLEFSPDDLRPGNYRFSIGTAGSAMLVAQTLLPAVLTARAGCQLVLEGGTHNPLAPSFDFLERAFLPLLKRMGPTVTARLGRPGFYPAGGGRCEFEIEPVERLHPFNLEERGELLETSACALIANLPEHIAHRELAVVGRELDLPADCLQLQKVAAMGPGNAITVTIKSQHITEVFTGFGMRGVRAEDVAARVVKEVRRYLAARVAVGRYLADQLILPFAIAGSGSFVTLAPSRHATTNIAIVKKFLDVDIDCQDLGGGRWRVALT